MFVGALNGLSLQRVAFGQPSQAERREPLLRRSNLRIRDVQQSRDGSLYVATERSFGGADADGTILRLEPIAPEVGYRIGVETNGVSSSVITPASRS